MNNKPLRRIQSEAVLGGVAAGLADYFGMDKALMRVILVVLMIFAKGFPIILLYIILWAALPTGEPTTPPLGVDWASPNVTESPKSSGRGIELVGYGLLLIGGFMLFDRMFYWMHLQKFIPAAILIGIGLFLILRHSSTKSEAFPVDNERATPSWTHSAPINDWQPPQTSDTSKPAEPTDSSEDTSEPKA